MMYLDIININYYKYVPLYIKELKLVLKLFRHVVFNDTKFYINYFFLEIKISTQKLLFNTSQLKQKQQELQQIQQRIINVDNIIKVREVNQKHDNINATEINGGTQQIYFDTINNRVIFNNLSADDVYYWLDTITGENNFNVDLENKHIHNIEIDNLKLNDVLQINDTTQIKVFHDQVEEDYNFFQLIQLTQENTIEIEKLIKKQDAQDQQIEQIKITNDIQNTQLDNLTKKQDTQDQELLKINLNIQDLQNYNTQQDKQIDDIKLVNTEQAQQITELQQKDFTQDQEITKINSNILYLQTYDTQQDEKINLNQNQIQLLSDALDQLRGQNNLDHENLQQQIDDIDTEQIDNLDQQVQDLQEQINQNNEQLSIEITDLQNQINQNDQTISDLEKKIDKEIKDREEADKDLENEINNASGWEKFKEVIEFLKELNKTLDKIIKILELLKTKGIITTDEEIDTLLQESKDTMENFKLRLEEFEKQFQEQIQQ